MPNRSPTYQRSVFSRLTAALTLAPVLVFTGVSAWAGWQSQASLKSEIINQINDDMASLSEIYIEGGAESVSGAIVQRLSLSPLNRAGAHYLFKSNSHQILSGDLTRPAADKTSLTKAMMLETENFGTVTARETIFKGGETLVVARENKALKSSLSQSLRRYLIGLLTIVLLGYFLTRKATAQLRRRIDEINATLNHVGQGHLDARLKDADSEDELGILGTHINAMITRAERLLSLRKRVTDQVAHEMRSPLTRLDARLLKLGDNGINTEEIESARAELQGSVKLLDGLLDVSSLDAQQGDKRGFECVNLTELVQNIAELFEPVAEEAGQTLNLDVQPSVIAHAAPSQIGRLVSNLTDNAIKYADNETDINLSLTKEDKKVIFRISNKGPQILGDAREDIFTPFFRHPDIADRQGYGLGLALCRAIAARHEGDLEVEPNPKFTVFKLTLPAA